MKDRKQKFTLEFIILSCITPVSFSLNHYLFLSYSLSSFQNTLFFQSGLEKGYFYVTLLFFVFNIFGSILNYKTLRSLSVR